MVQKFGKVRQQMGDRIRGFLSSPVILLVHGCSLVLGEPSLQSVQRGRGVELWDKPSSFLLDSRD